MNSQKTIYTSLKNKIEENEQKFQMLFTKKNNIKEKEKYNENKENNSFIENKIIKISRENSFLTEKNSINDTSSISISVKNIKNKKSSNVTKKINKKIFNKTKKYTKNNSCNDNPINKFTNKNFLKSKNNAFTSKNNSKNKFNNRHVNKKKEAYKCKNNEQNKISTQDKDNNFNTNKYNESYIFDSNFLDTLNNANKSSVNINQMFKRFEESQRKKNIKLENLKKQKEEKEKKAYTHRPHISKNSKNLSRQLNDDFLTRQKIYNDKKNKNDEILKENILRNELEKIRRNSFVIPKKFKENSSTNISFISEVSSGAHSMIDIDNRISKLFEWDNKRKEKIIRLQKEKSKEINKNKHIPKINKRSKSMVHRGQKENIFIRLAKEDEIVKAKKKIMADLLSPSFQPNINLTFRKFDEDEKYNKKIGKNIKNIKRNSVGKNENFLRITVNRNNNIKPKVKKKEEIIKEDNVFKKIESDEIYDIYRRMIINNLKIRNKSIG